MRPESLKLLHDIRDAAEFILGETAGVSFNAYEQDRRLRNAVERNFIVIGEALSRLARTGPETAKDLSGFPEVIGFRNVVVHGYDTLEDAIVWGSFKMSCRHCYPR